MTARSGQARLTSRISRRLTSRGRSEISSTLLIPSIFWDAKMPGAIAIRDVEDGRADGFPDGSAPAVFERAMDLRAGVGGRGGGEPEGIGGFDSREVDAQIRHGQTGRGW